MKLTIVEPHGDDAFISCSSTLMNSDFDIYLCTMSDRSSEGLREFYPSIKDTSFIDTKDVHYDYHLRYNTHNIHRRYQAGEDLYKTYCYDMDGLLVDNEDAKHLHSQFLNGFFTAYLNDDKLLLQGDLLLMPVGLFHPNHYATRRLIDSILDKDHPRIYYVDKPYIEKRYVREILSTSNFISYTAPVQSKETRAEIFKKVYPTEQSLLRFSSKSILECKDIYAVRPQDLYNPLVLGFLNKVSDMKKGDNCENTIRNAYQD